MLCLYCNYIPVKHAGIICFVVTVISVLKTCSDLRVFYFNVKKTEQNYAVMSYHEDILKPENTAILHKNIIWCYFKTDTHLHIHICRTHSHIQEMHKQTI
jgi:hypothetical protein